MSAFFFLNQRSSVDPNVDASSFPLPIDLTDYSFRAGALADPAVKFSLKEKIKIFVQRLLLNSLSLTAKIVALVILGSSIALIPGQASAEIIFTHGLAVNAQGRKGVGSFTAIANDSRAATEFTLSSITNLTDMTVTGYARLAGGAQGSIALMDGWHVSLHRWDGAQFSRWDQPTASADYSTPSNLNYTDVLGSAFGGYFLHNIDFTLTGHTGFDHLNPGRYLITVFAGSSTNGGGFYNSSSNLGDPNSGWGKPPGSNDWSSLLALGGADYTPLTGVLHGSPVPEPTSFAALALGVGAWVLRKRKAS